MVCQLRFPQYDLTPLAEEALGAKGTDGMVGLRMISDPVDPSKPEWRYSHQGWKEYLKLMGQPLPETSADDFLERYRCGLSKIVQVNFFKKKV